MSVTTRTNLATNPSAGTNATNYAAVPGTGGTAALAWNAGVGYQNIPGFPRVSWTVATTAITGGISYAQAAMAAATQYATQIWVRCSKAQTLALKADFRNASNTIVNTVTGASVAVAANTWTQLTVVGTSGAAVTNAVFTAQAMAGGSNWANGDWLDGEAICPEAPTIALTNMALNPRSIGASYSPNNVQWTSTSVTGIPATPSGATTATKGQKNAGTDPQIGSWFGIDGQNGSAVQRSMGVWMWASAAGYSGYVSIGGATSQKVALPAQTWTWVTVTSTVAGGYASAYVERTDGASANLTDYCYITGVTVLAGTTPPATHFDGLTLATATIQYGWTGAPNASTSVQWAGSGLYFDGSFVSAGSVVYAWTGAANASTSTATTYVPAIALTGYIDMAPCPRVGVTITDLAPSSHTVNVWRTADGKRTSVRSARGIPVVGSTFITDYETPLGRVVQYDIEVLTGVSTNATAPSQTVTLNALNGCIQDPLVPASSVAINIDERDGSGQTTLLAASIKKLEYNADVSLIPILGSSNPVAIIGQVMAAQNVPISFLTDAAEDSTNLRELLKQTALLLVRPLPSWGNSLPGLFYTAGPKVAEGPMPHMEMTWWELTGNSVASPRLNVLVPIWTYGDIATLENTLTYQHRQDLFAAKTYLDELKSPTG